MPIKQKKCKWCGIKDDIGNLQHYSQLDKKGQQKYNNKNQPVMYSAHKACNDAKIHEKNEWNALYDYLLVKYFNVILPSRILEKLKALRAFYTFQQILDCFIYIEDDIAHCKVNDTAHLCNLLNYKFTENVEDFLQAQSKRKKAIEYEELQHAKKTKVIVNESRIVRPTPKVIPNDDIF